MLEEITKRPVGRPKKVVDLTSKWVYSSNTLLKEQIKKNRNNVNNNQEESLTFMPHYDPNFVQALAQCADEQLKLLRAVGATLTRYTADESLRPVSEAIKRMIAATESFQQQSHGRAFLPDETEAVVPVAKATSVEEPSHVPLSSSAPTFVEVSEDMELGPDDTYPIAAAPRPIQIPPQTPAAEHKANTVKKPIPARK